MGINTVPMHGGAPAGESQPEDRSAGAAPIEGMREKSINILIVDDEPKNLAVLETLLDDPSYRLVRAESADQALLSLVVEEFALLILDIRMPGMTGFELAQMIKERKKTAQVPIIFLSAYYNEDEHVLEGYSTGAVDYLHKPVNPIILRSKVAVFAELHRKNLDSLRASRALLDEVSQRRRAEEQLRELNENLEQRVVERTEALSDSEERYRLMVDGVSDYAIFTLDAGGHVASWNAGAERIIGYEAGEIVGQQLSRFYPPAEIDAGKPSLQLKAAAVEGRCEDEGWRMRKDGSVFWAHVTLTALRDASGRVRGFSKITRDITDHKYAVETLRRRESELQTITDNAPDIIARFDRNLRHVFVNAAITNATGLSPEMFLGKTSGELWMSPAVCEVWDAAVREVFRTATPQTVPFVFNAPDGERHYESRLVPELSAERQVEHVLAVTQDVTAARKAAEALARAKEAADAANLAKDQFLAVLSHELRTPLTPVRMAVSGWERQKNLFPPEFVNDLAMIRRNVDLECRLIDDMLDLNRIACGKLELQFAPVDLNAEARHAVSIVESDAAAKQIVLSFNAEAAQANVLGDAARLQQILWNLVRNAIKFTPSRGSVIVRTYNDTDGQVCVEVRDTGVGIDPASICRIFNAFEQGGADITRRFGGLGLGLSISKALCDMHCGTLTAHSDGRGQGATFTITLDVADPTKSQAEDHDAATPVTANSSSSHADKSTSLLLVEDHQDAAHIMNRLLTSLGYRVEVASSVAQAIKATEAHHFDLIISDIGLPDGTGYDLLRNVSSRSPIRGIALTGYGMDEDVRRAEEAGFAAHLTKPINIEQLELTIKRVLGTVAPGVSKTKTENSSAPRTEKKTS